MGEDQSGSYTIPEVNVYGDPNASPDDLSQQHLEEIPYTPPYDGPSIGVDPGGVSLDEYEQPGREALEALSHQHMPHTEIPEYEVGPVD